MTKQEFYLDRSEDAYRTAKSICQSRRNKALKEFPHSMTLYPADADVQLEYSLILQEWYDDYRAERV
tara:strand:+ start:163 stop:363 length:201 start_codon:yes stop_codon:yes gene_type:complete